MSATCPVCDLPEISPAVERCPRCGWQLRGEKIIATPEWVDAYNARLQQRRLEWHARRLLPRPHGNVTPSAELIERFELVEKPRLTSLAVSADGLWVATGGYDSCIRIWPLGGGPARQLMGGPGRISTLLFHPHGAGLLAASAGWQGRNTILRWSWPAGKPLDNGAEGAGGILACAFNTHNAALAVARSDWRESASLVQIWDQPASQPSRSFQISQGAITALAWSPREPLLALGGGGWGSDNLLHLWPEPIGQQRPLLPLVGHSSTIAALAFSPDGRLLASGGHDGSLRIWEAAWQQRDERGAACWILALAWHPGGQLLAAACGDGAVRVWDIRRQDPPRLLLGHSDRVTGVGWLHGGRELVSSSWDGSVIRWRVEN